MNILKEKFELETIRVPKVHNVYHYIQCVSTGTDLTSHTFISGKLYHLENLFEDLQIKETTSIVEVLEIIKDISFVQKYSSSYFNDYFDDEYDYQEHVKYLIDKDEISLFNLAKFANIEFAIFANNDFENRNFIFKDDLDFLDLKLEELNKFINKVKEEIEVYIEVMKEAEEDIEEYNKDLNIINIFKKFEDCDNVNYRGVLRYEARNIYELFIENRIEINDLIMKIELNEKLQENLSPAKKAKVKKI